MFTFNAESRKKIFNKLHFLYGEEAESLLQQIELLLDSYLQKRSLKSETLPTFKTIKKKFSHKDIILNIYANSIQKQSEDPLQTLYEISKREFSKITNGIHLLPFYEWDTDKGFSIIDYYMADKRYGNWAEFEQLQQIYDIIMIDWVLNHCSIDNEWVQKCLCGDPKFRDFVITFELAEKPPESELKKITRARPNPVLTQYYVYESGRKKVASLQKQQDKPIEKTGWVWTTFSRPNESDGTVATKQIDLNYENPKVFLEGLRLLLFYLSKGANWIRLDAIGYLWKEIGTNCIHLPQTHTFIELISEISLSFSNTVFIAEVNEPQDKAMAYLPGESGNKSDMVYLFTHYPLAVHAVLTGTATYYNTWIASLKEGKGRFFISILGTHDGMGMKTIGEWLPESEKDILKHTLVNEHGALPNYSLVPGGEKIIYEICSTPWNLINNKQADESLDIQIKRYIAVFALGLSLKGVPSLYINGLIGLSNVEKEFDENRSINRQIIDYDELITELQDDTSKPFKIMNEMKKLWEIRRNELAFELSGPIKSLDIDPNVVLLLLSSNNRDQVISIINVSNTHKTIELDLQLISLKKLKLKNLMTNVILDEEFFKEGKLVIQLEPYAVQWLKVL